MFDLVHSWTYDADIATRIAWLTARTVPLVSSIQAVNYDPDVVELLGWPKASVRIRLAVDRTSIRWSRPLLVACSHFVADSASHHLQVPREEIAVIYNSVDPQRVKASAPEGQQLRKSLGIRRDALVYLNVGRLDPQKGQEELLRAFALIESSPPAHLAILGEGQLDQRLRQLANALNIAERVHFLGSRADVGACLQMADVFVFPSRMEGLPVALIEAMAHGLPCVTTDIGPLLEVVGEDSTALIVPLGSIAALRDAMLRLESDSTLRAELGTNARARALQRFHVESTVRRWEVLYRSVAPGGNLV